MLPPREPGQSGREHRVSLTVPREMRRIFVVEFGWPQRGCRLGFSVVALERIEAGRRPPQQFGEMSFEIDQRHSYHWMKVLLITRGG